MGFDPGPRKPFPFSSSILIPSFKLIFHIPPRRDTTRNVRLVELCTIWTIVVLKGVSGTRLFVILIKHPTCLNDPPQNYPKCGNPVDGQYRQGCALLRKKFKDDLFTYCIKNGILQDSFEPPNDNTNIVNALQEPFVVKQDPGKIPHKVLHKSTTIVVTSVEPFNNQTVDELPQTMLSFDPTCYSKDGNPFTYDSTSNLVHDSPNIPACYDDDDDDYTIAITHKEPDNSLSMGDEHLDTILATESDEFIKSSVENLVLNPSESEGENECDSFSDEDIPKEIYSKPLFDEEIISMKIDLHYFNAESDLIESLLNHNSSIISSSSKIDSLFDEFAGELTLVKSIPTGTIETNCDPEEETHFIKRLLYDNSSPLPPEEFISKNSNATFESFSPTPIPVEDSDSLMEEIDLSFTLDD
uniref:Reverse transcriptase domain-containing protein n=1 Tax=Tanacetum cinerariifolium TaxID=118510 RepID=A0A6L2P436_TANCI|nr:hypothetical protein [Tanacetum cinerariifolium]